MLSTTGLNRFSAEGQTLPAAEPGSKFRGRAVAVQRAGLFCKKIPRDLNDRTQCDAKLLTFGCPNYIGPVRKNSVARPRDAWTSHRIFSYRNNVFGVPICTCFCNPARAGKLTARAAARHHSESKTTQNRGGHGAGSWTKFFGYRGVSPRH